MGKDREKELIWLGTIDVDHSVGEFRLIPKYLLWRLHQERILCVGRETNFKRLFESWPFGRSIGINASTP